MFKKIGGIIKSIFGKNEKDEFYPPHFLKVCLNPVAKSKGINDNYNKEIHRIKNGKLAEIRNYSPQLLENMKYVYEIPVFEETIDENEEYTYDSFNDLGVIKYKK